MGGWKNLETLVMDIPCVFDKSDLFRLSTGHCALSSADCEGGCTQSSADTVTGPSLRSDWQAPQRNISFFQRSIHLFHPFGVIHKLSHFNRPIRIGIRVVIVLIRANKNCNKFAGLGWPHLWIAPWGYPTQSMCLAAKNHEQGQLKNGMIRAVNLVTFPLFLGLYFGQHGMSMEFFP